LATPGATRRDQLAQRLDAAAQAGWLYYALGKTQGEIARKLEVSRQTAQRLVSLSLSEGLIKVRLDHPIGRCLNLARAIAARFDLGRVRVVPGDADDGRATSLAVAQATAAEMERCLSDDAPQCIAFGTGRALKAAAAQLCPLDASRHRIVSLAGNIASDGSASCYDVIFGVAERTGARCFPLPLPLLAASAQARRELRAQPMVEGALALGASADVAFVGIGQLDADAPLVRDGFVAREEIDALTQAGAVGEIIGWAFDRNGRLLDGLTNDRVASVELPALRRCEVIGVAAGAAKVPAIHAALCGRLVNGLITDEPTAEALLCLAVGLPPNSAGSR